MSPLHVALDGPQDNEISGSFTSKKGRESPPPRKIGTRTFLGASTRGPTTLKRENFGGSTNLF